jgi:two-component system NtrC family response regulator
MVHLNLGITHYKIGDYEAAFAHLRQSHEIGITGNWPHRQCFANIALGNVYRLTRDYETARKHLHTAYNQAQELQFPREEALALEFLGDVYRDEGAPNEARRFYARAMAIGLRIAPEGDIVMEVHRRQGECHNLEGHQGQALTSLKKALEMARAQGDRYEAAVTLRVMCETTIKSGDLKSARKCIDESVAILAEIEARHELAVSLLTSANLHLQEAEDPRTVMPRIVRLNEAWKQATMALDLFIKVDVRWWTEQGRALVSRVSAMRNAQEKADKAALTSGRMLAPGGYAPGEVIIYQSSVMRDMLQLCDMFALTGEPVLITGETGTGKEIVAKRLHHHSERADRPLVVVNVAAIPETMFEREFFGHVKGAFSGATQNGEGFAARANGGTLFLDEIGDLPLDLQPKLLRLLQEGTYQALGDPRQRHTDIRLVAATNANLERKVQEGGFRADLYYRLRTLDLPLPAVRDRSEDILPLMRHFLGVAAGQPVDLAEYFNRPSLAALEEYDWPGNVREVAMVARQAHVAKRALGRVDLRIRQHDGPELRLTGPGLLALEASGVAEAASGTELTPTAEAVLISQSEIVERSRILLALDGAGGNRNTAARELGIGRSTLYRKMVKLGIPTRRF